MAEERPSLHIDTDWKKQAQEEKKRLAEQEAARAKPPAAPAAAAPPGGPAGLAPATGAAPASSRTPGGAAVARDPATGLPPASIPTLVNSVLTQVLFYLGDLASRGGEPVVNLDLAKHHLDTLGVLEEKTKNNLTDEERRAMDVALYEGRMRFVSVASQYIS